MLAAGLLAVLSLTPLPPGSVTIDGFFNEWVDQPKLLMDRTLRGSLVGPGDLDANVQLAVDAGHLYVALQVVDDTFQHGTVDRGDGVELLFRGAKSARFRIVLNDLEEHPAQVFKDGKPFKDAKIYSTTRRNGWAVELALPVEALPGLREGETGFVVTIRDSDADPMVVDAVLASGPVAGDGLPAQKDLSCEATAGLYTQYLKDRGGILTTLARRKGDLAGDSTPEEIVVNDADLVVTGLGLPEGASYYYFSHGWPEGSTLGRFDLMELDGRPGNEILVEHVVHGGEVNTTILEIFGIQDGLLKKMWGQRLAEVFPARNAEARSTFRLLPNRGKGPARFEVTRAVLKNLDEGSYPPDPPGSIVDQPLPLPWTSPGGRKYALEGDVWQVQPER